jgi:hypothetical protein
MGNELPGQIQIRCLQTIRDPEIQGLTEVLIDCVEGGSSVGFMLPLSRAKAEAFWRNTSASVARPHSTGSGSNNRVKTLCLLNAGIRSLPARGSVTVCFDRMRHAVHDKSFVHE